MSDLEFLIIRHRMLIHMFLWNIMHRIQDRKREFNLYKVFLDTFAAEIGNDLRKVELIEALLFLSMIPLHGESIRHQMVMLGTGLEILNRVVNIQVEGEE